MTQKRIRPKPAKGLGQLRYVATTFPGTEMVTPPPLDHVTNPPPRPPVDNTRLLNTLLALAMFTWVVTLLNTLMLGSVLSSVRGEGRVTQEPTATETPHPTHQPTWTLPVSTDEPTHAPGPPVTYERAPSVPGATAAVGEYGELTSEYRPRWWVTCGEVTMSAAPAVGMESVGVVAKGTRVLVSERSGGWSLLYVERGWVRYEQLCDTEQPPGWN